MHLVEQVKSLLHYFLLDDAFHQMKCVISKSSCVFLYETLIIPLLKDFRSLEPIQCLFTPHAQQDVHAPDCVCLPLYVWPSYKRPEYLIFSSFRMWWDWIGLDCLCKSQPSQSILKCVYTTVSSSPTIMIFRSVNTCFFLCHMRQWFHLLSSWKAPLLDYMMYID